MKVLFLQPVQVDGKPFYKGDKGEISNSMYNTLIQEGVKVEKVTETKETKKENANDKL